MENTSLTTQDSSSIAVSMETYSKRKHDIHWETVEVTSLTLEALTYWHAGWDILKVQQDFDADIERPHAMTSHLPLLLHEFSWDASSQILVMNTFKHTSSKDIQLVPFYIPNAVRIHIGFLGFLPTRRLFIECGDGQKGAVTVQLNLKRRKAYKEACPNVSRW